MSARRRQTRQGRAVLEAIQVAGRPLGPGEILAAAATAVESLSQATVYRQIRRLREDGLIREVVLPGTPTRYEAATGAGADPGGQVRDDSASPDAAAGPTPARRPGAPERRGAHGESHHHFFHCDDCDAVYPVPGCSGDIERLAPPQFEVRRHEIVLYGRCRRCAAGGSATDSAD